MPEAQPRCIECNSRAIKKSSVPGLVKCMDCGKVQPESKAHKDKVKREAEEAKQEAKTERALSEGGLETVDRESEDYDVPDLVEVCIGWRAWGVKPVEKLVPGDVPVLRSVTYGDAFWTPRAPMRATCNAHNTETTPAIPAENCQCGLYSAKTYGHLMSMGYHRYDAERNGLYHVVGRVKLWGKVIEGTQGWRAEIGYPDQLYVPFEAWSLAKPLEEAYGCPVRLKNILGAPRK